MKKENGFFIHHIGEEHILASEDLDDINFSQLIAFNDTASWLWENLHKETFDAHDLADLLTIEYDVDHDTALQDAHRLLKQWQEVGIISE